MLCLYGFVPVGSWTFRYLIMQAKKEINRVRTWLPFPLPCNVFCHLLFRYDAGEHRCLQSFAVRVEWADWLLGERERCRPHHHRHWWIQRCENTCLHYHSCHLFSYCHILNLFVWTTFALLESLISTRRPQIHLKLPFPNRGQKFKFTVVELFWQGMIYSAMFVCHTGNISREICMKKR